MAETPNKTDYTFTSDIRGGTNISGQVTGGQVVQGPQYNYYNDTRLPTAPNSGNENLSSIQILLQKIYAKSYRSVIPVSSADFYFDIKEKWVNLTLKLEGDSAVTDNYTSLLKKAFADADMLIIEGDPGVGKSSLMHRLAYEWSQSRLTDYDLVLYVEFRKLREYECKGIKELIIHYMKGYLHEEEYKILDNFLSDTKCCLEHNILVLLDGYDESCLEKQCQELSEYFNNSISRPLLFNILITSRKGYLPNSRHLGRCVFADIIGFTTEPQREEYLSKHFKAANDTESSEATAAVTRLLNTNENIKELSETPLLLTIICLLHKKIIEGTEVELYLNIIWCLIDRHQRKNPQLDVPKLFQFDHDASDKFAVIEKNYQYFPQLHLLGTMAMQDIFKSTFTEADLKKFQLKKIVRDVGLLKKEITRDSANRAKTSFSFVHRSIQECIIALTFLFSNEKPPFNFFWNVSLMANKKGYGTIPAKIQKYINIIYSNKKEISESRKKMYSGLAELSQQIHYQCSLRQEQSCASKMHSHNEAVQLITEYKEPMPQSSSEALQLLHDEAEEGDTSAQYALGVMYNEGLDVLQSDEKAVKWFRKSAEQGHAYAQHCLGDMYKKGKGVPQSDEEAVKWYTKSAEQGNEYSQNDLGDMYRNGDGVHQSYEEAVKWYWISAEQGNEYSQNSLGDMYKNGEGVHQSYEEAVKWYTKSAEQGHATAQDNLEEMYRNGQAVPQSDEEAVKWYTEAAERGNADAQYNLGNMYQSGKGVPQSDEEAVKWYWISAEQGNARAQGDLGFMYEKGQGIDQSYDEAVKWYKIAAEKGNARAQSGLGYMYHVGRCVPQSDVDALKWYRKSAEQGDARAQHYMGIMYSDGKGVHQSDEEAVEWYRKAAEQGNPDAQHYLGIMYSDGKGVHQSDEDAVKWYRKAAEQGNPDAQYALGYMYSAGRGVHQSDEEALKWYRLSAEQGNVYALSNLRLKCDSELDTNPLNVNEDCLSYLLGVEEE